MTKDVDSLARSSIKDELSLLGGGSWLDMMDPNTGTSEAF